MKISMLCFSLTGWATGKRLEEKLCKMHPEWEIHLDGKSRYLENSITESHTQWTERQFEKADAIIFICACGIAVRSIAPFLVSKKTDPAVLVADECGKVVISLLSGHLGGANELTEQVAGMLDAFPVITTATDLHNRFAVDLFAKKNHCDIRPMRAAIQVSAAILAGEPVGFYSDYPWEGDLPEELVLCTEDGLPCDGRSFFRKMQLETKDCSGNDQKEHFPKIGIAVSIRKECKPFPVTVHIIPRIATMGIGCRKEKEAEAIQEKAEQCLSGSGLFREALEKIASIELKKDEAGILALAKAWEVPFETYTAEELQTAKGSFLSSEFVGNVTGVDNVCERSAVLGSGQGSLIRKKMAADGVTAALAVREWRIHFE